MLRGWGKAFLAGFFYIGVVLSGECFARALIFGLDLGWDLGLGQSIPGWIFLFFVAFCLECFARARDIIGLIRNDS